MKALLETTPTGIVAVVIGTGTIHSSVADRRSYHSGITIFVAALQVGCDFGLETHVFHWLFLEIAYGIKQTNTSRAFQT